MYIGRNCVSFYLPSIGRIDTAIWMYYIDANKTAGEKSWRQPHKNAARNIEQVWDASQISSCTATYHPSRKLTKLDEPDMQDTAGEVRTNS